MPSLGSLNIIVSKIVFGSCEDVRGTDVLLNGGWSQDKHWSFLFLLSFVRCLTTSQVPNTANGCKLLRLSRQTILLDLCLGQPVNILRSSLELLGPFGRMQLGTWDKHQAFQLSLLSFFVFHLSTYSFGCQDLVLSRKSNVYFACWWSLGLLTEGRCVLAWLLFCSHWQYAPVSTWLHQYRLVHNAYHFCSINWWCCPLDIKLLGLSSYFSKSQILVSPHHTSKC